MLVNWMHYLNREKKVISYTHTDVQDKSVHVRSDRVVFAVFIAGPSLSVYNIHGFCKWMMEALIRLGKLAS